MASSQKTAKPPPQIVLDDPSTESGAMQRLFLLEAVTPYGETYDATQNLETMRLMRQAIENRLKSPGQYNARAAKPKNKAGGATPKTDIITRIHIIKAPGQFAGFGTYPTLNSHLTQNLKDILKIANDPNHPLHEHFAQFVKDAITASTEKTTPPVAKYPDVTGWRTEKKGSPGSGFQASVKLGGNQFFKKKQGGQRANAGRLHSAAPPAVRASREVYGQVMPKSEVPRQVRTKPIELQQETPSQDPTPIRSEPATHQTPSANAAFDSLGNLIAFWTAPSSEDINLVIEPSSEDQEDFGTDPFSEDQDDSGGGQLAARITDMHVCPLVTAMVPHVGGPVAEGSPDVYIASQPAARVGDMLTCVGGTDVVASGSSTVFINGKPAARVTDKTAHGGALVTGAPTVLFA